MMPESGIVFVSVGIFVKQHLKGLEAEDVKVVVV
jgi:hypothetical protein